MTKQGYKDEGPQNVRRKQGTQQNEINYYPGRVTALYGSSREPCGPQKIGDDNLLLLQLIHERSETSLKTVRTDSVGQQAPIPEVSTYVHWFDAMVRVKSRTSEKRRNEERKMLKTAPCLDYC